MIQKCKNNNTMMTISASKSPSPHKHNQPVNLIKELAVVNFFSMFLS